MSTCTPETQQSTPQVQYVRVHSPSAEYIEYNRIHLKYVEYATIYSTLKYNRSTCKVHRVLEYTEYEFDHKRSHFDNKRSRFLRPQYSGEYSPFDCPPKFQEKKLESLAQRQCSMLHCLPSAAYRLLVPLLDPRIESWIPGWRSWLNVNPKYVPGGWSSGFLCH